MTMIEKSKKMPQVIAATTATLTMLSTGIHIGWPSPYLWKLIVETSDVKVTSSQASWIVSSLYAGSLSTLSINWILPDLWGRKFVLLSTAFANIISWTLIAFARNHWWFYVARFIAGIGTGITYSVISMYIGEISEDGIRGRLAAIANHAYNLGILLSYCLGPWIERSVFSLFGIIVSLSFFFIFLWMPESPYFLVMKNKTEIARKSLIWLRGTEDVAEDLRTIESNVRLAIRNPSSFKEIFATSANRKALLVASSLYAAKQMSGKSAILAYSTSIFEESQTGIDSSVSVILIGVIQLLSGMLPFATIDGLGRRPLLLISVLGTVLSLSGEATYFQAKTIGLDTSSIRWLPVTAIVCFMITFTFGLGTLPTVITSEIFSYNVKARASMITVFVAGVCGILVTQIYQIVSEAYGVEAPFWLFAGITFFLGLYVYFIVPETNNKSLHAIQMDLGATEVTAEGEGKEVVGGGGGRYKTSRSN